MVPGQNEWFPATQRFQVRLAVTDRSQLPLRVGATGSVTVYTTENHPINWIAEFWQRLTAWVYYLR